MLSNCIFIQIKGLGFTFLLDKRMKHNLISPTLLAFFKTDKQRDSLLNNDIGEVNVKPEYNNSFPFLPAYVDSISLEDTFHYVGKKIIRCSDNKLRRCKAVKFNFEHGEHTYSELFFVDKALTNIDKRKQFWGILTSSLSTKINYSPQF